ncbi:MAG: hopanoid biosynthesis-associated protein HpnK [Alphaproteobacteria bacterium]|nr:hopanoid biosynthesis-associated protein HpnK [Alphaproteobacteria bacterium]
MKGLIVTADDFGSAIEVNDAVERAHGHGILTAASLMVGAPATQDAIARARNLPGLRVGLHLVLVDGTPLSPPHTIPDLVGADGKFRDDLVHLGVDIFFRPHVRAQLAREIAAQFEAFAATGLDLDHVNGHKHFHLHPTVAQLVIEIGKSFGLRAARVPDEPRRLIDLVEGRRHMPDGLAPMSFLLRRRFQRAKISTTDRVFGLAWSGAMTRDRLSGLIARLPEGVSEIYLHPATCDRFAGSASNYRYRDELDALLDPQVIALARDRDIRLGGFAEFSDRR